MRNGLAAAALGALLLLAGCADESIDVSGQDPVAEGQPAEEATEAVPDPGGVVKITECGKNDFGAYWKGTLKNTSDERSDFSITGEITDANGDRVDDAGTIVLKVGPGQRVKIDAVGLANLEDLPKKIKCHVLTVDRTASE